MLVGSKASFLREQVPCNWALRLTTSGTGVTLVCSYDPNQMIAATPAANDTAGPGSKMPLCHTSDAPLHDRNVIGKQMKLERTLCVERTFPSDVSSSSAISAAGSNACAACMPQHTVAQLAACSTCELPHSRLRHLVQSESLVDAAALAPKAGSC